MAASKVIEKEIKTHQRIISRLKREIFGVDKTHRSRYIKEFHSEFRSYRKTCTVSEVIEKASRCDIVYFGDYHPLEASQDFVLRLMEELSVRGRKVVLALEMLYVHQQEFLDRWMKGRITEEEFLEAIDYRSEWGFSWESYRRLFERAKHPFIPIFGIDSEPRDHLRYIRRRDRLAAQRIGTIRKFFPDACMLVVIGESHLASKHLPADVHRLLGRRHREMVIVQNIDDIYWRLLRKNREETEAVSIDAARYCVFTASPMLKYGAYREMIDVWIDGEEVDRHTPFFHETIENILSFLVKGRKNTAVTLRDERRETLDAVLPELQCRTTYHACSSYLRARRVSPRGIIAALESLKNGGLTYVPEINTVLIVKFDPAQAIGEAARFVLHLMRRELWKRPGTPIDPEADFYGAVIAEALVCFGARIVNPGRDCAGADPLLDAIDSNGAVRRTVRRRTTSETRELVRLYTYLVDRERGARGIPRMTKPLRRIMSLGLKKKMLIAKALGSRLGDALHRSFHEGRMHDREIVSLFGAPLNERGVAVSLYYDLLDRAGARSFFV